MLGPNFISLPKCASPLLVSLPLSYFTCPGSLPPHMESLLLLSPDPCTSSSVSPHVSAGFYYYYCLSPTKSSLLSSSTIIPLALFIYISLQVYVFPLLLFFSFSINV